MAHRGARARFDVDHRVLAETRGASHSWFHRRPYSGTLLVAMLEIPVATIGTRFGGIPQGFPRFHLPELSWTNVQHLFQPAVTIAVLAAIESLLSAVVADGMIDDRHDSNQELMAQASPISPVRYSAAFRPPGRSRAPRRTFAAAHARLLPG